MQCIAPIAIKNKITGDNIPVKCGRCYKCVKQRISEWSFRLRKEGETSLSSLFLTLTYDTENVPITKRGYMTLYPRHVTLFLKKLRKKHTDKIKYFYVGEYGGKTNRPHYHLIIFNADPNKVETTWNMGSIHYGEVTGASIGYTLKYICKDGKIPMHKNDDRLPEFGRMSKGIGENYITKQTIKFHSHRQYFLERTHLTIDGKKISMPKYYKNKLYDEWHKYVIKHKAEEIYQAKERLIESMKIDVHSQLEAHKAETRKMFANKYKNKYL